MGSYNWDFTHNCSDQQVRTALETFGFTPDPEDPLIFYIDIMEGKPLRLRRAFKKTLEVTFMWGGGDTTEIYYDYLIKSGYVLGQVSAYLDLMSQSSKEDPSEEVFELEISEDDDNLEEE